MQISNSGLNHDEKICAVLLHLSFNFAGGIAAYGGIRKEMELGEQLWSDVLRQMAGAGVNMVVLNLDDAVAWESHPEIAVRNAWSPDRLRKEIANMRRMGLEPIPMLNFSTSHDAWMKTYARMVSSGIYYEVCRNLIAEAIDVFDTPRFFHIGMDEESAQHQRSRYDYIVVRQGELWWHDLLFYVSEIEKKGTRAWMWSDYSWNHPDEFVARMPKSIVQSNWYYGDEFDTSRLTARHAAYVNAYQLLEAEGYDQIPTGKFYDKKSHDYSIPHDEGNEKNLANTLRFGMDNIGDERLLGFLTTFWKPTIEKYRPRFMAGAETIKSLKINNK